MKSYVSLRHVLRSGRSCHFKIDSVKYEVNVSLYEVNVRIYVKLKGLWVIYWFKMRTKLVLIAPMI